MAEEERLRADIVSRFRASRGAEGRQRDRISEVSRSPASDSARHARAPSRSRQTVAEASGDADGETFGAGRARSARSQANEPKSAGDRGPSRASAPAYHIPRRQPRMEKESGIARAPDRPRLRRAAARILDGIKRRPFA